MAGTREGRRREAQTENDRGEEECIGMLVRRQVMPMWAYDPVQRHVGGEGVSRPS